MEQVHHNTVRNKKNSGESSNKNENEVFKVSEDNIIKFQTDDPNKCR